MNFKDPICSSDQKKCVEEIYSETYGTMCLPQCEGILVTSYIKTENSKDPEFAAPKQFDQYNNYKGIVRLPSAIKSKKTSFRVRKL